MEVIDTFFHNLYKYVVREALDISFCIQVMSEWATLPSDIMHQSLAKAASSVGGRSLGCPAFITANSKKCAPLQQATAVVLPLLGQLPATWQDRAHNMLADIKSSSAQSCTSWFRVGSSS